MTELVFIIPSDKNSPCCKACQLIAAGQKCREAQRATCEQEAKCNGISAECPSSAPQLDGTECLEKGKCRNGTCLPFCETQNYQSCMCDTVADACKRCCRYHLNDTCFPIDHSDILPDGTPCVHGFCNNASLKLIFIYEPINRMTALIIAGVLREDGPRYRRTFLGHRRGA